MTRYFPIEVKMTEDIIAHYHFPYIVGEWEAANQNKIGQIYWMG